MRFFLAGIIFLLLSACLSQPDCTVTASNKVKIGLKKLLSDSANFVKFPLITVSGTDNAYYTQDSVSSLVLPLNPLTNETTFRFHYDTKTGTKVDSVTLSYVRQTIIISPDCGGYIYYSKLSVVATSFIPPPVTPEVPNPKVVNPQLSTSATINLQIKL